MQNDANTLWQLDVADVQRVTHCQILQIDLDVFRKRLRQTGDFQFGNHMADDTTLQLDARAHFTIDEVQAFESLGGRYMSGGVIDAVRDHFEPKPELREAA